MFVWYDLLGRRRRYDFGNPMPISYGEIEAFARQMRIELTPWQVGMLCEIDDVYLTVHHKAAAAKENQPANGARGKNARSGTR